MFLTLLVATLLTALVVSALVMWMFSRPLDRILARIIADDISSAWLKYLKFAIIVVGVSSGVRIYDLERYITAPRYGDNQTVVELTRDRWVLEMYRTVIETLQGIAWMLLVFFVVALIAYVIVRIAEMWRGRVKESVQP
jgi:ABC-type xylose transport system permease subunit